MGQLPEHFIGGSILLSKGGSVQVSAKVMSIHTTRQNLLLDIQELPRMRDNTEYPPSPSSKLCAFIVNGKNRLIKKE
jgi:hypothetical protein